MLFSVAVAAAMLLNQSAQQFDLRCTGETSSGARDAPVRSEPFDIRLRVDLTRNVWCYGRCGTLIPLVDVNSDRLLLEQHRLPEEGSFFTNINRNSGVYVSSLRDPANGHAYRDMIGFCTKEPFSGMPGPLF